MSLEGTGNRATATKWVGRLAVAILVASVAIWVGRYLTTPRTTLRLQDATQLARSPHGLSQWVELKDGRVREILFEHPTASLAWRLELPPGRHRFSAAVRLNPKTNGRSDGGSFRVRYVSRSPTQEVAATTIDSGNQSWRPFRGTFESEGGDGVLLLETDVGPAGNASFDWLEWANPTVECGLPRFPITLVLMGSLFAIVDLAIRRRPAASFLALALGRTTLAAGSLVLVLLAVESTLRLLPELLTTDALANAADAGLDDFPSHNREVSFEPGIGYRPLPNKCFGYPAPALAIAAADQNPRPDDPGTVRFCTDQDGFRNPRDSANFDLAVVGDSFVQSTAVSREQSWPAVVGRTINASVGIYGVGGYAPQQYAEMVRRFVLRRSPRTVVVAIFEGNDLDDAARYERYLASGLAWNAFEAYESRNRKPSTTSLRFRRSFLGSGLWTLAQDAVSSAGVVRDHNLYFAGSGQQVLRGQVAGKTIELRLWPLLLVRAARSEAELRATNGLDPTFQALREIRDLCRRSGAQVVVALFPSGESIYPFVMRGAIDAELFSHLSTNGAGEGPVSWDAYLRNRRVLDDFLARSLEGEGFPVISLFDAMEAAAAAGVQLYNAGDSHWNAAGHELAGELVARALGSLASARGAH